MGGNVPEEVFIHVFIRAIIFIEHLHVPGTVLGRNGSREGLPAPLEFMAMLGLDLAQVKKNLPEEDQIFSQVKGGRRVGKSH